MRNKLPSLWLIVVFMIPIPTYAQLPSGFYEEVIGSEWNDANGLTFDQTGRMYVWEKGGRVYIVENDAKLPDPLIDISEEVGDWRDYGLLGFVLDPDFRSNGYIYLSYVVDRHHLLHFGTPNYDPDENEYFNATIARVTRYTANSEDDFQTVDPASRKVLIGETKETGIPILHQSHAGCAMAFGEDGTLLVSTGDAASYSAVDTGGNDGQSYAPQGLIDSIIRPKEDVGAFRAQLVDSYDGKMLRIDPDTGEGLPSNPFYDASDPDAPRSKVWALGFRNPFRFTIRPLSGGHLPSEGNPGAIYLGEVGWGGWEQVNVQTVPGENFGWPVFEGFTYQTLYWNLEVPNYDAPNPLYDGTSCTQEYFYFKDLIQQETLDPNASFDNPCDSNSPIPSGIDVFFNKRPAIDWNHSSSNPITRVGIYNGFEGSYIRIEESGSPVEGDAFPGFASVGGVWYLTGPYPPEYNNTYFHADYGKGWIKGFTFNEHDTLKAVSDFHNSADAPISLAVDPVEGHLYYVTYYIDPDVGLTTQVRKILYGGNLPPKAVALRDINYGNSPLTVTFHGSNSADPEGLPLTYAWDFGDGSPIATSPNPQHTFIAPDSNPVKFEVELTVTDSEGLTATAGLVISLNNTPPKVTVVSPQDSSYYPLTSSTIYNLIANVVDAEHTNEELVYAWRTTLLHNDHTHPEPIDNDQTTTATISPVGCDGETYSYQILLTVTDGAGLSNSDTVYLFPDCPVKANDDFANFSAGGMAEIDVLTNDIGDFDISTLRIKEEAFYGTTSVNTTTGVITYMHDGTPTEEDHFSYLIDEIGGPSVSTAMVYLSQYGPSTIIIDLPLQDEELGAKDLVIHYSLLGDLNSFDHIHFILDSSPHIAAHHLSGSYTFENISPGPHTVVAQLVFGHHQPLPNPEAHDTVSFEVMQMPAGDGLEGYYFDDPNFGNIAMTRIDPQIDFDWGMGSPHADIPNNNFSVRWRGTIIPFYSEDYTFYSTVDDGVRVWINDMPIIDDWNITLSSASTSTPMAMTAGQSYDIRVDYVEGTGTSMVEVEWASTRTPRQVISQSNLFSPGALPVELLTFNANVKDYKVQLDWSTATEKNNDFFTLERSIDGISFEKLVVINGHGNSASIKRYTYLDDRPLPGLSYYRLQQTDFDGTGEFLAMKSVNVTLMDNIPNAVSVFPNPTSTELSIVPGTFKGAYQLVLLDAKGKVIIQENCKEKTQLDTSGLNNGLYVLKIVKDDFVIYRKIHITH